MDRRLWTSALTLLLAPVAAVFVILVAYVASGVLIPEESEFLTDLIGEWSYWLQETGGYAFTAALAIGLALLARRFARNSALHRPLWLAVAAVVPVLPILALAVHMFGNQWRFDRAFPELPVWAAGMVLTLWLTAALAAGGRLWAAWTAGLLGALVTSQIAVMTVLAHITTPVDWGDSPLWLLSYFNYRAGEGSFHDEISPTPELYLSIVPYVLSFVIAAARQAPRQTAGAAPVPA